MSLDTQNSHTLALVSEALAAVEDYCSSQHTQELLHPVSPHRLHGLTHGLNRLAGVVGLHVTTKSYVCNTERSRHDSFRKWTSVGMVHSMLQDPAPFDVAYLLLADEPSREVFDWCIQCQTAYAFIGPPALELFPPSMSSADYARYLKGLHSRTGTPGVYRLDSGWTVDSDPDVLVDNMILGQYEFDGIVSPQPGWTALDVGAYKGETTLWLAQKVGPGGTVLAFEPNLRNKAILEENVGRNSQQALADIRVIGAATASFVGHYGFAGGAGGAAALEQAGETQVDVTTIDETVALEHLAHVDFIKMDIEGTEVDALKGARETLTTFMPALAICVYHKPNDIPDIIALLHDAVPCYQLYLSHKSPLLSETVLFATTRPIAAGRRRE